MKYGVRKNSVKKSISARTTGRVKRKLKRMVNPFYGKKGMGWINNPKKALYNKIYRKTTVSGKTLGGVIIACIWYPILFCFKLMWWLFLLCWLVIKYMFLGLWWICAMIYNGILSLIEQRSVDFQDTLEIASADNDEFSGME